MSDVRSWGTMVWELVTGKDAWSHVAKLSAIRRGILNGERPQWPEPAPEGFVAMQELGQSALVYDTDARPTSRQLLMRMNTVVASLEIGDRT